MFCNQCEQTNQGRGCTKMGVCGKNPETAALQDLLTYAVRGLSEVAVAGRKVGVKDPDINRFIVKAIFSTLTNVNFDPARLQDLIYETIEKRDELRCEIVGAGGADQYGDPAAGLKPSADKAGLVKQGEEVRLPVDWEREADIRSLQELTLYGIRGAAAYADHAAILGQEDDAVYTSLLDKLAKITDKSLGARDWVDFALDTGKTNLRAMELLDAGNTTHFGHPEPSTASLGHKAGKAILVTGHDLKDLANLLQQTEGQEVNIYTHGEMLPSHGYPELKKYVHLAGHFGSAWQNQKKELPDFPGPVLFTTNCIQEPAASYKDNVFTTGLVAWPGTKHVQNDDFGPLIEHARQMPGFVSGDQDSGDVWVGYARNTVLRDHPMGRVIDTLVDYVNAGTIKHFFLVGGCDGANPGRNYYNDFVDHAPPDTVILTLACGKFRFFDRDLGAVDGVPRLIDVGQCNDAYSAIVVADALSEALGKGINEIPLSLIVSWYEQKAVAILLTLLHKGFKGIRLGPSMPGFLTADGPKVLVDKFNVQPISTPEKDIAACLGI
ncbi:Hydroxylamine reductase (EC [Olavius algarvensis Delta 1 endosymbiont]|nr:Hydroxylamine reductase (EC [Olavius algarvensis Delta 1 endosymbiont]